MANICLIICKEENLLDLVRLNILGILTAIYNKNQANNIFHQASYHTLCNLLWEKDIIGKTGSFKL